MLWETLGPSVAMKAARAKAVDEASDEEGFIVHHLNETEERIHPHDPTADLGTDEKY